MEAKYAKARKQLVQSLKNIMNVPRIGQYINGFVDKYCCFFSNRAIEMQDINALSAFNRLDYIDDGPFVLSCVDMENYGFQFRIYSGNQTCILQ
ncbi:MAG: hypothetical protein LBH06_02495 [Rikenellaceae bacterium]|nr:hypothetical protein [Rikenellaceae bacterium]